MAENGNNWRERAESFDRRLEAMAQNLELFEAESNARFQRAEKLILDLAEDARDTRSDLRAFAAGQVVMQENLARLTERVDTLAQAQQHTDERLNALIDIVDGFVRGKQPPPAA